MNEMINKSKLLQALEKDLLGYRKRLDNENFEYMKHYYQGKIDYIDQLKCIIDLIAPKEEKENENNS